MATHQKSKTKRSLPEASKKNSLPDPADLDIRQKAGQLLMLGFRGMNVDSGHPLVHDIRENGIGGVLLFDYDVQSGVFRRNIESVDQVHQLTTDLASYAKFPLFLAIDQEGGTVNRLKPRYGFASTVSHREMGERDDLSWSVEQASRIAGQVKISGCNLNLAPCLDLAIHRDNKAIFGKNRCFSDDPEVVALHASAFIRAHHQKGLLTAVKHFPGHGSSREDTHHGMADVTGSWKEYELLPYQRLFQEGIVDMVMSAHIFHRDMDHSAPATLSADILTGLLRRKMGYNGVILSDDMQMKAITDHFGQEAAIEKALKAGVDMLIFGNNLGYDPDLPERFIHIIERMIEDGRWSMDLLDQSVRRLFSLKRLLLRQTYSETDE